MSERYTRLNTLPKNMYIDGAPVLIAAGALLKDNQNGNVLVQLKLQNLNQAQLVACKVSVRTYEPGGEELPCVESYAYLDLLVSCGEYFGTQNPIYLPDSSARNVSVSVIQAVFQNGEVWNHTPDEWKPLPQNQPQLKDQLSDMEMQKQYELEVGGNCEYVPIVAGSWFLCTCGAVSLSKNGECSKCKRDIKALLSAFDIDELTRKKEARLEKEAEVQRIREREQEEKRIAVAAAAKRVKRIAFLAGTVTATGMIIAVLITQVVIPRSQYKAAEEMLANGNYSEAIKMFTALGDYQDSAERAEAVPYVQAEALLAAGDTAKAAIAFYNSGDYQDSRERSFALWDEILVNTVATGGSHTVGLKANGTVMAVGNNKYGQCDVKRWTDIVAVAAGQYHTVGLKAGGTVVAVGDNGSGECDVEEWTDIVAVAAGGFHTVGLKADGTVVAVGYNGYSECDVEGWSDIVAIAAGEYQTVGLKADGTVVAVGYNKYGQCDVGEWTDIVAVASGRYHTVGLKADSTVVTVGYNEYGQCDVEEWTDIVAVEAGQYQTVGLKADGTMVVAGKSRYGRWDVERWTDIVAVAVTGSHIVCLKADGTVVATGDNADGQCAVHGWAGIKIPGHRWKSWISQ